ncbi:MAG TPA: DUF2924 domain-containing protein [Candidatus Cybelea sp.]|nr:DUF2924 domain-containing protein [Candidatus Cybelea sp.]
MIATNPEIAALEALPSADLRSRWRQVFGQAPPHKASREILLLGLAYRLQEKASGGLTASTRQRLERLARTIRKDPDSALGNVVSIKPGTRLLRQWRGEQHEVTVLDDGFIWKGKRHASLSAIARTITGTRWNGWTFFGLKQAAQGPRRAPSITETPDGTATA